MTKSVKVRLDLNTLDPTTQLIWAAVEGGIPLPWPRWGAGSVSVGLHCFASFRSSCGSHHRAETFTIVNKWSQVSESSGSSSDKSLRTPPIPNRRLRFPRVCVREAIILPTWERRPIRPPEHPPLRDHTRLPPNPHRIGSRQAKGRNRLSDSAVAVHGGHSGSIRQVIPTASGAFLGGAPIKDNPFAARRPLTHLRTFYRFRGSYSPR